ncbi:MAG: extensin family protein [Rhodanobacter sp.]
MAHPASARRRAWLLLLLAMALASWGWRSGRVAVADAWNPWAPLQIDAQPNLLTGFKLSHASAEPQACKVALAQARMDWTALQSRVTGPGCGFDNAVRVTRSSVTLNAPFALSCRAALSLAMWERHVLQPVALAQLGTRVRAIEHFGSYACRNLYGQVTGARSQHATADALDIAAFVMADGRRVSVVNDWTPHARQANPRADGGGIDDEARKSTDDDKLPPETRFLREVHDGACRYFDAVLGPDYNAAHADHFHFDRGRARTCR